MKIILYSAAVLLATILICLFNMSVKAFGIWNVLAFIIGYAVIVILAVTAISGHIGTSYDKKQEELMKKENQINNENDEKEKEQ